MHFAILSKSLPPVKCGIADYSVALGTAISSNGHKPVHVAGEGQQQENRFIFENFWHEERFPDLVGMLEAAAVNHLILQYTPLTFAAGCAKGNWGIVDFWAACRRHWKTSLVLHETYYRTWRYPPSLIRGTGQKRRLKQMVANSDYVFTASQPLFHEIKHWSGDAKRRMLPISSNIDYNPIDRGAFRIANGIPPDEIMLTLFGGGVSLPQMRGYVESVDSQLSKRGVPARWLLLGGVKHQLISLKLPVSRPGYLTPSELSGWLQAADLMLMPHVAGVCAKRSTLMTALQHGLPVVGTRGPMTDVFWNDATGVALISRPGAGRFAETVLRLAQSTTDRRLMGEANRTYFEARFTWDKIAAEFLREILS